MENERIKPSRRKFLKSAATIAGTAIGINLLGSSKYLLFAAEPKDEALPWYGIVFDIEKCIGCGKCAKSCKIENDVPQDPFFFRTWVEQYTVKNDGSVDIISPNGGIDGFEQRVPDSEIFKSFFCPQDVQSLFQVSMHSGVPCRSHIRQSGRGCTH